MPQRRINAPCPPPPPPPGGPSFDWVNFDPQIDWWGTPPAAPTIVGRYFVVGHLVFFHIFISSADSNGNNGYFDFVPPVVPLFPLVGCSAAWFGFRGGGYTVSSAGAVLRDDWGRYGGETADDDKPVAMSIEGFYEV